MASAPLIDFDAYDLSRTVVTREELYAVLKQQGRFAMVDGLLHYDLSDGIVVGYLDVRADAWWAADHIPGRPILPGNLMIEAGAQTCTYDFVHRRKDLEGAFVGFSGIDRARFRMTVEPECRMIIVGKTNKLSNRMFSYLVQGFIDRRMAFEAEVKGVVV